MLSRQMADQIASEARRLLSLARDIREEEGVYAADRDLRELLKSLSSRGIGKPISETGSLSRRVGDFARPDSKLFQLVFASIERCEE
jgi:hypothetical protein